MCAPQRRENRQLLRHFSDACSLHELIQGFRFVYTEHDVRLNNVYTNSVRTLQETHYVSATMPSRLILFGKTVAGYCENRTEHTDTLCGQNAEFWYVKVGGTYSSKRVF
jgi:hypothetical protein